MSGSGPTTDASLGPDASSLSAHVDALLARYLQVLDRHERLRARARAHVRAGHLALAEAHFKNPLGRAGTHFGRDMYDGKTAATFVLEVRATGDARAGSRDGDDATGEADGSKATEDDLLPWTMTARWLPTRESVKKEASEEASKETGSTAVEDEGDGNSTGKGDKRQKHALPTPPASRETTPAISSNVAGESTASSAAKKLSELSLSGSSKPEQIPTSQQQQQQSKRPESSADAGAGADAEMRELPPDPIRQFGILVPPALRAAQASFQRSLLEDDEAGDDRGEGEDESGIEKGSEEKGGKDGGVAGWVEIAVLDAQLKALEVEIRRARKRLRKAGVDGGRERDLHTGK